MTAAVHSIGSIARTTTPARPRLVDARLDAWLLGGGGIVAWVLMAQPFGFAPVAVPVLAMPVVWLLLAVIGTHFGISYHLGYGQGRAAVQQRRRLLIWVPVGLLLASTAACIAALAGSSEVSDVMIRVLLTAVFTLTGWHYVKQVYGVARLTASIHGLEVDRRSAHILRYGLYPVWFLDAAVVWAVGFRPYRYGFDAGVNVLPRVILGVVGVLVAISALALIGVFIRLAVVWRRVPPASMWTPVLAGMLWLIWLPNHVSAILVLGALHAVQYLVCAHRAEIAWGVERGEVRLTSWWASVFGAGMASGMLLSYWMPMWLGAATGATALGLLPAALLFAFFNLHHYAVDAAIWRSRDGHIRRIVATCR